MGFAPSAIAPMCASRSRRNSPPNRHRQHTCRTSFRPRLEIEDIGEELGRDPFVLRRDRSRPCEGLSAVEWGGEYERSASRSGVRWTRRWLSGTPSSRSRHGRRAGNERRRSLLDSPLEEARFEPSVPPGLAQLSRLMHAKRCDEIVRANSGAAGCGATIRVRGAFPSRLSLYTLWFIPEAVRISAFLKPRKSVRRYLFASSTA